MRLQGGGEGPPVPDERRKMEGSLVFWLSVDAMTS